jgi:hypothetical protein
MIAVHPDDGHSSTVVGARWASLVIYVLIVFFVRLLPINQFYGNNTLTSAYTHRGLDGSIVPPLSWP